MKKLDPNRIVFKLCCGIGMCKKDVEVTYDKQEFMELTEEERENMLQEDAWEYGQEQLSTWYEEIEDES